MNTLATKSTSETVMARPGFLSHPKFRRLCHILREPVPHVFGYLELMWSVGYETSSPYLGDQQDVELACQYPGESGRLFEALLECKLIDELEDGTYQIHDLAENAPQYVKSRLQMRQLRNERRKSKAQNLFPPDPEKPKEKKARVKKEANSPPPIPPELDFPGFREAWDSWLKHRAQKKAGSMSDEGIRRCFARMAKWGVDRAILAIDYSMSQQWDSVYEERQYGSSQNGSGGSVGSRVRVGTSDDKIKAVEAKTFRSGSPVPGGEAQAPLPSEGESVGGGD